MHYKFFSLEPPLEPWEQDEAPECDCPTCRIAMRFVFRRNRFECPQCDEHYVLPEADYGEGAYVY